MGKLTNAAQTWRFGIFEFDAHSMELRRSGIPIKLRDQSSRILAYLLEHAGRMVTREELRQLLWPADTFVDFDHSLNTAVMTLREALGDSAEKPLYIETLPKRGYRFVAPVSLGLASETRGGLADTSKLPALADLKGAEVDTQEPMLSRVIIEQEGETTAQEMREPAALKDGRRKESTRKSAWPRWIAASSTAIAVVALALGSWRLFARRAQVLTTKDTIVLADFTNSTDDPVFDGALRQGLSVQLEQSPFLSIVSEGRIQQTLNEDDEPACRSKNYASDSPRTLPASRRHGCARRLHCPDWHAVSADPKSDQLLKRRYAGEHRSSG
jgi:DNA-binding winged helix-turn-helix (wHTH) protein